MVDHGYFFIRYYQFLTVETLSKAYIPNHANFDQSNCLLIQQVKGQLGEKCEFYFYRTHDGSEVDLVLTDAAAPIAAIEIKYTLAPKLTKGNRLAIDDISAKRNFICTFGNDRYPIDENIEVIGLDAMISELR